MKFSLMLFFSFWLIFCQFQPDIVYKKVVYKKIMHVMEQNEFLITTRNIGLTIFQFNFAVVYWIVKFSVNPPQHFLRGQTDLANRKFSRQVTGNMKRLVLELVQFTMLTTTRSSRPEVFCKNGTLENKTKFTGKHLCQGIFFTKVSGLKPGTLFKKKLWHRCFPVNFARFLGTPFLLNISGGYFCRTVSSVVFSRKMHARNFPGTENIH